MNISRLLGVICASIFSFTSTSTLAALVDNGNGLIYDTVLDITWGQPDTTRNWDEANAWASGLTLGGVSGWRLPYISVAVGGDPGPTGAVDCETASEVECRDNELGYMFYHNLSGTRGQSILTSGDPDLVKFPTLQPESYWSADTIFSSRTWLFNFNNGGQAHGLTSFGNHYTWAVHDGNISSVGYIEIDIEKLTNGLQADDANDPSVLQITQGETVNWSYEVTNTGGTDLSEAEIIVTDSQPGVTPVLDTGSDAGGDLILSTGETWVYTATAQALDLENPPAGVTIVQGCNENRPTYENIGRAEVLGSSAFDEDLSHYCDPRNILPLEGRLPATPGGTDYQAYYDPNLNITWAADTAINDPNAWDTQMAWAAGLNLGGVTGWRLPSADVNGDTTVVNCAGGGVVGCSDNEMGYLFWEEGITQSTPGPFSNLDISNTLWWSDTPFESCCVWSHSWRSGAQAPYSTDIVDYYYAWAVYDGDVPVDTDNDGITDDIDNCILVENADQRDTDIDGFGNICDPDFDNNLIVNASDLAYFKTKFFTADADADLNGDDVVNAADLAILKTMFFKLPGPSGLAP